MDGVYGMRERLGKGEEGGEGGGGLVSFIPYHEEGLFLVFEQVCPELSGDVFCFGLRRFCPDLLCSTQYRSGYQCRCP
jgi:hypothetical protein